MIAALRRNLNALLALLVVLQVWDALYLLLPQRAWWFFALVGWPVVLLLPGLLIAVCLGARRLTVMTALFALGFSVLLLYIIGLQSNFVPVLFGSTRPLDTSFVWWSFNVHYVLLAIAAAVTYRTDRPGGGRVYAIEFARPRWTRRNEPSVDGWTGSILAGVAAVAPVLSVMGAVTLNNEGTNTLAFRSLLLVGVLIPAAYLLRRRVSDAPLMFVLWAVSATLLLGTSLRSWYVSGQDMQHEFQVFNLMREQARWDITTYRDPYNACLSLTLFPYSLSRLLRIEPVLVFRVVDQLLFSCVPLVLFSALRRFLGRDGAFIAAVLFLALPTFSIDVPYITRQQLAFLFVALTVAATFGRSEPWVRARRAPVIVYLSAGVVVSHYSTAYLFVGALVMTFVVSWAWRFVAARRGTLSADLRERIPRTAVLGTLAITMIWFGPVTGAVGDLFFKVSASSSSLDKVFSDPASVLAALGKPNAGSEQDGLREYVMATTVTDDDPATVARQLQVIDTNLPPTALSRLTADYLGVHLSDVTAFLYYGVGTKVYLLSCMVGIPLILLRSHRRRLGRMPMLYAVWCVSVASFLAAQVLLPGLANDYGLTRAFMQAFIVLCVPMVVAIRQALAWSTTWAAGGLVTLSTSLFLLYTGLVPQLTGGLHRQVSLDNGGPYYGTVYPHPTDVAAVNWVGRFVPPGKKVNMSDFASVYAYHPNYPYDFTSPGIFPFQVKPGDYALLARSQTRDQVVYTFGSGTPLRFTPALYATSDVIYSAGEALIVRRR